MSPKILRPEDPVDSQLRWKNFISNSKTAKAVDFAVLQYPDDRGVIRNFGRPGSKLGPASILENFEKLFHDGPKELFNLGAIKKTKDLVKDHKSAQEKVFKLRAQGTKLITLGGGHDWGAPDILDFPRQFPEGLIINLDAHLDMRPDSKEKTRREHSGFAFRKILETHPTANLISYGIQPSTTNPEHLKFALAHRNSKVVFFEDTHRTKLEDITLQNKVIFLSVCMDVFSFAEAPGVSAPQVMGISAQAVLNFIRSHASQIAHLGIYETNPKVDRDAQTSKLAARLMWEFLKHSK